MRNPSNPPAGPDAGPSRGAPSGAAQLLAGVRDAHEPPPSAPVPSPALATLLPNGVAPAATPAARGVHAGPFEVLAPDDTARWIAELSAMPRRLVDLRDPSAETAPEPSSPVPAPRRADAGRRPVVVAAGVLVAVVLLAGLLAWIA